jgi:hypothetical protein
MTEIAARPQTVPRRWHAGTGEIAFAAAVFGALCVAVLVRSTSLLEPDDLAYRASIVALVHGHLTLSTGEYQALAQKLGGISQWVELPDGRWISEKNPGYPFFAAPFQLVGLLRLAPLFYGALGCVGVFFGARRWLGRWGGAWAVAFLCGSGAALAFAWRATMPTFTDASLIAAGTGALLWALLADDATPRRRTIVAALGFLALESATFIRYTNVVVLAVAVVAVALARPPRRLLACCGATLVAFGLLVALFDELVYGGVLKTGYASGEITFAWSAVVPNAEHLPKLLLWSIPSLALALAAVVWIALRGSRRDRAVAAALFAGWLGIFALYAAYTWTARMGVRGPGGGGGLSGAIHVIRFYVPAIGAVALLAAWLATRLPRWAALALVAAALVVAGYAYPHLVHDGGRGPGGGPPGGMIPGGPPPGGPGGGLGPSG